jgi:hypothetical protein
MLNNTYESDNIPASEINDNSTNIVFAILFSVLELKSFFKRINDGNDNGCNHISTEEDNLSIILNLNLNANKENIMTYSQIILNNFIN